MKTPRSTRALVPYGVPIRAYWMRVAVIRREERKRFAGLTEKEQAHIACLRSQFGERRRPKATHCKRGHRFTKINTFMAKRGARTCKTCRDLSRRRGRPIFVEQGGAKIYINRHDRFFERRSRQLRAALIAAHPDKGGTSRKFRDARAQLEKFLADEAPWYAAVGVPMPNRKRQAA